jgi:signal transduction histidine kinase
VGATSLVFGAALYLAWRLAVTRVVRPTRHLLGQMELITQGHTDAPPAFQHRVSEFAALQDGLDSMRQQLRAHDAARDAMLHRLETVLESINDGFYLLDPDGRFAYVNGRAATLLGQRREALHGRILWEVLSPRDAEALRGPFEQAVRTHQAAHLDAHLPDLALWLELQLYPGEQGLSVYFQDVQAVRDARLAQEAQRVAEASSRAKTEFLSRMSHELRTPLNAVLGFAQLLEMDRQEPPSPRQRAMLGHIMTSGQHLLDMISEVLDVSRIESGTLRVTLEPIDAIELLHLCEQMVAADARQAGLLLLLDLPPGPLMVMADRTRLKQVLLNLLSNAIKYNRPAGAVTLKAQRRGSASVRLSVQDSGLGMSPAQQAHLFEPFNRLGREHSGVPGTGIGLVICQRLIQMMGGELSVESLEGQGSMFAFELPCPPSG